MDLVNAIERLKHGVPLLTLIGTVFLLAAIAVVRYSVWRASKSID